MGIKACAIPEDTHFTAICQTVVCWAHGAMQIAPRWFADLLTCSFARMLTKSYNNSTSLRSS